MKPPPWTTVVAMLSSLKESERRRLIGSIVLVLGIVGACVFYGIEARSAEPAIDDVSAPGYLRVQARETGRMMGHFGVVMLGWQEVLARPGTQALMIAAGSGL